MFDLINDIDNNIILFVNENFRCKFFDIVMPFITSAGNCGFIWIIIDILLLCKKSTRKYGIIMTISLLGCVVIGNIILKPIVKRQRPFDVFTYINILIKKPTDFSFPSGHTMSAFSAATVICFINNKIGCIFVFIALIVAYSRLYLFVHFPTDIIFGAIIGIIIAYISRWLFFNIFKNH